MINKLCGYFRLGCGVNSMLLCFIVPLWCSVSRHQITNNLHTEINPLTQTFIICKCEISFLRKSIF